ncbi:MAG: VCBS repeat-containing protein [Flavobacteriales bacterium]|nr:VCBS repeat-containing protein [Flavobacteriales bacterium]
MISPLIIPYPYKPFSATLDLAWGGGLNFAQTSDIDLNCDGIKDLFFFDRAGNSVVTLLNNGSPGPMAYSITRAYDNVHPFPELHDWVLLRDYNCDGKEDIFAYTNAGFTVYKNIGDCNRLAFTQVGDYRVGSNYISSSGSGVFTNLYIAQTDIPGIEDIDGDGDLDILSFALTGSYIHYHKNLSMETYGTCDSLKYELRNQCWGFFSENSNNNSVTLNAPCDYNVPAPEMGGERPTTETDDNDRATTAHAGSTILPLDLDDDGDKEVLLGDISFNNIVALYNGGSVSLGMMTSEDTLFPSYDTSVDLPLFPGAYYEDVDNDGKRDLITSPNGTSLAANINSMWYYQNMGTDAAPQFHLIQEDLFQGRMIDLGEGAYPVAFDHDGDGVMDLLVSNYGYYDPSGTYAGKVAYFHNTGTLTAPAFQLEDEDYMNLSSSGIGTSMYPAFADMDGDGDMDMYVGDLQGKIHYFVNTSTGPVAQFVLQQPNIPDSNNDTIDIGQFATPQFTDMDGDGLMDLIIGERNGNVNYYRNTGTGSSPVWTLITEDLGGVLTVVAPNVSGHSVPFIFTTSAGSREMLLGSESGWLYHYGDIDNNIAGTWTLIDSTFMDLRDGYRTALCLYDYTGDGKLDMVLGNLRGGLSFWNSSNTLGFNEVSDARSFFSLYPNPATTSVDLVLNAPPAKGSTWVIRNNMGQLVQQQQALQQQTQVNISALHEGIYLVRLEGAKRGPAEHLIVLR